MHVKTVENKSFTVAKLKNKDAWTCLASNTFVPAGDPNVASLG